MKIKSSNRSSALGPVRIMDGGNSRSQREKSMGKDGMTSYHHYYIIRSLPPIYNLGYHSLSESITASMASPSIVPPFLLTGHHWVKS